jgi:hypothetical protein
VDFRTLDNIFGYEKRYDFKMLFIDLLTLVQLYVVLSMYFLVYKYNVDSLLDYHDWNFLSFCGSLLQRPQLPCIPDSRTSFL